MVYSKPVKKKLRQLVSQAYEAELSSELKLLAEKFKLWEEGMIGIWDLEEAIHKFHNGTARDLYKRYSYLSLEKILPYALHKGYVTFDDVPPEALHEMQVKAQFYRECEEE